jgi:hypothetical protein
MEQQYTKYDQLCAGIAGARFYHTQAPTAVNGRNGLKRIREMVDAH